VDRGKRVIFSDSSPFHALLEREEKEGRFLPSAGKRGRGPKLVGHKRKCPEKGKKKIKHVFSFPERGKRKILPVKEGGRKGEGGVFNTLSEKNLKLEKGKIRPRGGKISGNPPLKKNKRGFPAREASGGGKAHVS